MTIPDTITINLENLKTPTNLDAVAGIRRILTQILWSPEVTPHADPETGEWNFDYEWAADLSAVVLTRQPQPIPMIPVERVKRRRHKEE